MVYLEFLIFHTYVLFLFQDPKHHIICVVMSSQALLNCDSLFIYFDKHSPYL